MNSINQIDVLVRRKIPILSSLIWWLLLGFLSILFILYLLMWPTKYFPSELATLYFIKVIPDIFKFISFVALICFIILAPIYYVARKYEPAILTLDSEMVLIKGQKIDIIIPKQRIKQIYFNELYDIRRRPKGQIQIVVKKKDKKLIALLLKNYDDADDAITLLSEMPNLKIAFYQDNMITDHSDE